MSERCQVGIHCHAAAVKKLCAILAPCKLFAAYRSERLGVRALRAC